MIKNKHVLKMLKFLRRDQNFEKKKGGGDSPLP